jgi:hypothetical protein
MTSQVLRTLERKGLIDREVDAADTRARRIPVTERGATLAPRAIAVVEDVDARFFADIPERDTLRFLRRLVDGGALEQRTRTAPARAPGGQPSRRRLVDIVIPPGRRVAAHRPQSASGDASRISRASWSNDPPQQAD